jgi:thioredoxin-like negative regulator of GroEL
MRSFALGRDRLAVTSPLAAGCIALAAVLVLLPSDVEIAAATRRALSTPELPAFIESLRFKSVTRSADVEKAAREVGAEQPASVPTQHLARAMAAGDVDAIVKHASRLDRSVPDLTAKISWDLLASGRAATARDVFERRPDRASRSLWRLRLELHRRSNDLQFARAMLVAAARHPGSADPMELVEAAYAINMPEVVLLAAEHGAIARLDRRLSLDLAQRAIRARRLDLLARIDRAGTPEWRLDDPWQAMRLAMAAVRTDEALRYAALLPSGQDVARRAVIMASGDPQAIRAMLLTEAAGGREQAEVAAEQLKETGFRTDAIGVLRAACTAASPEDTPCKRVLYLMGPRPDSESLAWLRSRAHEAGDWLKIYLERERAPAALSYVEGLATANETDMLLQRLKLARSARDRTAADRAMQALLDGRTLTAEVLSAIAAFAPSRMDAPTIIALARARVAAGFAQPSDHLDLAWAAWNSNNDVQARKHLSAYLEAKPDDADALGLMAEIEAKRRGKQAAQVWLQKMLALTPASSITRVEVLERMGRTGAALDLVEKLRAGEPSNKRLAALHARLLVASGDPGRARKVARK